MGHLVLIVADTLRRPEGLAGFDAARTTPFLARELPRARVLSGAVASSAWTVPSHVSLLAGADPWDLHYHGPVLRVPQGPTLGSRWREAGGESAAYSANGLVAPEYGLLQEYGSVNRFALNRTVAPWIWNRIQPATHRTKGPAELVDHPPERLARPPRSNLRNLPTRVFGAAAHAGAHLLTSGQGVVAGIDRFLRRRRSERPLHLFVNLMETHEPYTLSPPHPSPPLSPDLFRPMMGLAPNLAVLKGCAPARAMVVAAYLRALRRLDQRLEDLLAVLARRGMLREASVVLVSDHGQALGEQGFFGHGHSVQDEVARIPCALWTFRRGERTTGGPKDPQDLFDLRHLHDALLSAGDGPSPSTIVEGIDASLARRGPAVCYWEGPDLRDVGQEVADAQRSPVVRRLRLLGGGEDVTVGSELAEEGGHVRLRSAPGPNDPALLRKAFDLLERSAREATSARTLDGSVEQRLRTWGYA